MVSENEMIPVRIKFSKKGDLMYISHLDLAKSMQRIIVRSDVNMWYSEGYNPQPKIVFAVPLPVGVESDTEFLDIRITKPMELEEIRERISKNLPNDRKIIDISIPEVKFKHISYIDYTIQICSPKVSSATAEEIKNLFAGECNITKITKSGNEKIVNICEFIKQIEVEYNGDIIINTILCADAERYLNPELLIDAIKNNMTQIFQV